MDTKELQAAARRWGLYGWTFVKWTAVAAVIGCVCGFIGTLFHFGVHEVTAFRGAHPWVLYLLPRSIIELSPFHTSLFVTNLASINTPYIFHHCYEFGTTSVFICMGRPVHDPAAPEGVRKKVMPLSVVMDERIATGIEYSRFFAELFRNLRRPEVLEEAFSSALSGNAVGK